MKYKVKISTPFGIRWWCGERRVGSIPEESVNNLDYFFSGDDSDFDATIMSFNLGEKLISKLSEHFSKDKFTFTLVPINGEQKPKSVNKVVISDEVIYQPNSLLGKNEIPFMSINSPNYMIQQSDTGEVHLKFDEVIINSENDVDNLQKRFTKLTEIVRTLIKYPETV